MSSRHGHRGDKLVAQAARACGTCGKPMGRGIIGRHADGSAACELQLVAPGAEHCWTFEAWAPEEPGSGDYPLRVPQHVTRSGTDRDVALAEVRGAVPASWTVIPSGHARSRCRPAHSGSAGWNLAHNG
jgi:hypothetical protein